MTAVDYGPNTARVLERINNIDHLGAQQLNALTAIRLARPDRLWGLCLGSARINAQAAARRPAWDAAEVSARNAARCVPGRAAFRAVLDAVLAEVVSDLLEPNLYQLFVAPFDLVLDLPFWWSEPGSVNLFLEMVTGAVPLVTAASVVAALR